MAIDHPLLCRETHDLALPGQSFYPIRIPVSHWQLRHYISLPEPDILYYASDRDIYYLNTATKSRKHVAALPFEARCTASGHGWVCVGGEEEGHFAAIKLDGGNARSQHLDSPLPTEPVVQIRRPPSVKVERIGEEIVNSISIHRLQDEDAHLDDIVAVLTNNDKTVRIYSLPQSLETTVLDLPFPMNHATIAPDGQTLVAVGDLNQAYFFRRRIRGTPPQIPKPHNRLTSENIEWILTSVVNLHVAPADGAPGYFTTAWSPSGHLVAVGSEGGFITVFDARTLESHEHSNEEAIVAIVPSSRPHIPNSHAGAVRSMMFSPEPWDLLIWAEDQGRVCVGDLRTALKTKQIIHLEPKEPGLKRFECEVPHGDVQGPAGDVDGLLADLFRRHRHSRDDTTNFTFTSPYLETRRRQRQRYWQQLATRNARAMQQAELGPDGWTGQERQIFESLRPTRQREEARSDGRASRSVNYTAPEVFTSNFVRSSSPTRNPTLNRGPIDTGLFGSLQGITAVPPSRGELSELSRTRATGSSRPTLHPDIGSDVTLQPFHTNREEADGGTARPHTYRADDARVPRRRSSVVLSPGDNGNITPGLPSSFALEQWRVAEERILREHFPPDPTTPAYRLGTQSTQSAATAQRMRQSLAQRRERWNNLRAVSATSAAAAATSTTINGSSIASVNFANEFSAFIEGHDALLRQSQFHQGYSSPEIGVKTAGLAMSPDGRTLWAACEEGIFEVQMNLKGRMFCPSVEPR